ncbi:MAG: hypothetical protein WD207_04025 [Xanthobacteraceae bacterium]
MKKEHEGFGNLMRGQAVGCFASGVFIVASLNVFGVSGNAIVPLSLSAIIMLICWLGPQIVHELMEINDQLAG